MMSMLYTIDLVVDVSEVITNIKNTMSDGHILQKNFNQLLEDYQRRYFLLLLMDGTRFLKMSVLVSRRCTTFSAECIIWLA